MDYFLKEYKRRCKEEFKEYGFKTYRNNHYRVINDVFQSFFLHRSQYGTGATIEFGVIPLAQDCEISKSDCGVTNIRQFENNVGWFPYTAHDEHSINACIEEMLLFIKKYLMPFFEQTTNCFDAYEGLKKLDAHGTLYYHEYIKMVMCLKTEQYNFAEQHQRNIIANNEYALEKNMAMWGARAPEGYAQRMQEDISKKYAFLKRIKERDYGYIREWLITNEIANRKNLGVLK